MYRGDAAPSSLSSPHAPTLQLRQVRRNTPSKPLQILIHTLLHTLHPLPSPTLQYNQPHSLGTKGIHYPLLFSTEEHPSISCLIATPSRHLLPKLTPPPLLTFHSAHFCILFSPQLPLAPIALTKPPQNTPKMTPSANLYSTSLMHLPKTDPYSCSSRKSAPEKHHCRAPLSEAGEKSSFELGRTHHPFF